MLYGIRSILTSCALGTALCAFGSFSPFDEGFIAELDLGAKVAFAQDDDPFADDDEGDDPFGGDEEADPFEGAQSGGANDGDDPFAADSGDVTPFAPSSLPANSISRPQQNSTEPVEKELTPEEKARAEERAKYGRAEDVPDELKTEADFYETANVAELSALRVTPTNDAEWFGAAVRVARVGRPLFAKLLVEKALDAPEASPEASARILDSLGSGRAVYFVGNPVVGTVGAKVYEKVLASAQQYWRSDEALRDAFARATSGSVAERAQGVTDARKGGDAAIAALVGDLVSGSNDRRLTAQELLPFFEEDAVAALIAAVRGASDDQLAPLVNTLADFSDVRVGPELLARYYCGATGEGKNALENALAKQYQDIPDAASTAKLAYEKALGYYRGQTNLPEAVEDVASVWEWDAKNAVVERLELPVETVVRAEAAHWAVVAASAGREADAVPAGAVELMVAAVAERHAYRVGLDTARQGLTGFNAEIPPVTVDELYRGVRYALDTQHYAGALIPIVLLQEQGDETLCYGKNGPSIIVRAATCPDRRVRYQALAAIVRWNPEKPYPGSSLIVSGLKWFASSTGERIVVVADPQLNVASQLGQSFSPAGYRVIPVTSGREALLAAQSSPDVELVYATVSVSAPTIGVLAQALRSDIRTYEAPLLVGADTESDATSANIQAGREKNVLILPTPRDSVAAGWAIQKLDDATHVQIVPPETRLYQSQAAARALLQLVTTRPSIYELDDVNELIAKYLATPALFDAGLEFASTVKTGYAQTALVALAGDTRFGVETRNRAVDAFERQLSQNGLLLRGPDVRAMYDRYNASEKEDVQTQQVLSRLLDVYEAAQSR